MNIEKIDPDAGSLQIQLQVFADQQNVTRSSDGTWQALRATRDGAPIVLPWKMSLVLEGLAFHITVGDFSTPVAGGGATAVISLVRPRFTVAIPTGQVLLPLRVSAQAQLPLLATDQDESEILIAADRTQAITDGSATLETVFNMRTDSPRTSGTTARSLYTGDATSAVLGLELARAISVGDVQGVPANAMWNMLDLVYEPAEPPFIVGPATLCGFWGGTVATTGFAQAVWAELPFSAIS